MDDWLQKSQMNRLAPLPDVLVAKEGCRVRSPSEWLARKHEVSAQIIPAVFGPFPPAPAAFSCTELHTARARQFGTATVGSWRIEVNRVHVFVLKVYAPAESALPIPVVVSGDGCWHYANDAVLALLLSRGYALALFNRVEVAPDLRGQTSPTGALAAWAWGYHRAVDAVLTMPNLDASRIAVVGHSRGGKAALLAGATDERIRLTSANNSGAGGAGSFLCLGAGAETLDDVITHFPHWFSPALASYLGRAHALPFDMHFLMALIAPRALLTTEARGDAWANPVGTWQTHLAAKPVFDMLGVPQNLSLVWRDGGHDHALQDWRALIDFADQVMPVGQPT
jgi:hypothetical protein